MKIYKVTADCLVDYCLCVWYVKARNEREAWGVGYNIAVRDSVADSGTVDVERVKNNNISKNCIYVTRESEVCYD